MLIGQFTIEELLGRKKVQCIYCQKAFQIRPILDNQIVYGDNENVEVRKRAVAALIKNGFSKEEAENAVRSVGGHLTEITDIFKEVLTAYENPTKSKEIG